MAGLTVTLEIAKNTLLNTQAQIQTASNNISNAGSKTYARQKATIVDNPSTQAGCGWLGNGANVSSITQERDRFVEQRLFSALSDQSGDSTQVSQLDIASGVLGDADTGLSSALGAFWDSWDTLTQDTTGLSEQTAVYQSATELASKIKDAYSQLDQIATKDLPDQINGTIDRANALIGQIAHANQEIMKNEYNGNTANDLRDARYADMKELSGLIPIKFSEGENGSYTVTTTDTSGQTTTLVDENVASSLPYTFAASGGKLGGLLDSKTKIEGYRDSLDTFASALIGQVNSLHSQNGGTSVFSGSGAADIGTVSGFLSGRSASDESGPATQIAALRNTTADFSDGTSCRFYEYLSGLQSQIGTDARAAQNSSDFNQALVDQLDTQQQSISGTSTDEETVNIIQYQAVYQAASKLVQIVSDLLTNLINNMPTNG